MSERSAKGILIAAVLWILIFAAIGALYKFLVHPYFQEAVEEATSSPSQYRQEVRIAGDSFSGYSILRSSKMREFLRADGTKFTFVDDQADYQGRIQALEDRKFEMAVFTVDSMIAAGSRLGNLPATIVMVIDESKGADAVVAYKDQVPSIQDLDESTARFVLTPDSPSEFLARITLANFNLPNLSRDWMVPAGGAEEVYQRFRASKGIPEKRAYVLWEPFVSNALNVEGAHTLLDSSNLRGLILDVLVAERTFLRTKPQLVQKVIEAYFRARYAYETSPGGFEELFKLDSRENGAGRISDDQAAKLTQKIVLRNTLENYAHFGLLSEKEAQGLTHIEDSIGNIIQVLMKTGGLTEDPLNGKHTALFYDGILRNLQADQYHPGTLGLVQGVPSGPSPDKVRGEKELAPLDDTQWNNLIPIGTLRANPIAFGRGSDRIHIQGERDLEELAGNLKSWPNYYLQVVGQTRAEGDPEANRQLAQSRADAVVRVLVDRGVHPNRIRAESNLTDQTGGEAQSVRFVLGQVPY